MAEEVKQHIIQCFMSHRILTKKQAEKICRQIHQLLDVEPVPLYQCIESVNKQIEPVGMKISIARKEQDGSEWIGLVNTTKDTIAKSASTLTLAQQGYFKTVLELIVGEDTGVSSNVLLRAVDSMERKLSKRAAQEFLRDLVKEEWLHEIRGIYSIGPRTVLELLPFLQEITGIVVDECHLCSNRVVMGQRCGNENCNIKLHLYCVARLAKSRSIVKCPSCHSEWIHEIPDIIIT